MTDLTTRLLAEIERRRAGNDYRYWHGESTGAQEALAYLAALRKIVETAAEGITSQQGGEVRFAEIIVAVAEGLGVAL